MTAIILAAPDLAVEPSLVAAAGPAGLTVLRRCVDASDLLACAAAEPNAAVVLSAGVPRLSGDLIARMNPASRQVIALVVSDQDEAQLRSWGVPTVVRLREVPATMSALAAVLDQQTIEPDTRSRTPDGVFDTGVWTTSESGIVICVWGPPGAPGRTCTAVGLAETLARGGRDVLVVDADVHAPALALMLGIVDEASGLIVACRHADNGTLSARTLRASARAVGPGLSVLTGIPRPDRWPDVRASALSRLWQTCRSTFEITIVDVGADLGEHGHSPVSPVLASHRSAAAVTALDDCDAVVCICRTDPLSLARMAHGYPALLTAAPQAPRIVGVVSADRSGPAWRQVRSALTGIGIDDPAVRLEGAPQAVQRRLVRGLLPLARARRRERAGLRELARRLPAPLIA